MPIYEYECGGCGRVFEVRQKVSDPAPSVHDCGSSEVRRILSATSFVLKGTGWYKTDYADQDRGKEAKGGDESKQGEKGQKSDKSDGQGGEPKAGPAGEAKTGQAAGEGAAAKPQGQGGEPKASGAPNNPSKAGKSAGQGGEGGGRSRDGSSNTKPAA